jgi:multidrug transporter EmrE-like cation transporter
MNAIKLAALLLIVAGVLGAAYGGFSYTHETHAAVIGPLHLQVLEQERVNIPVWAGIGAIGAGVFLLLVGSRKA